MSFKFYCDHCNMGFQKKGKIIIVKYGVVLELIIDREAREVMHLVASVRLPVYSLPLSRLNCLAYDLHLLHGGRPWPWLSWLSRSKVKVKQLLNVIDSIVCHQLPCLEVNVGAKVRGQGQMSRSILGAWLAKCNKRYYPDVYSKKYQYQSMNFVCVSVIRELMRKTLRRWSISF